VKYRWTILAVGTASQAAFSAVRQGMPSLAPTLRAQFGISLTQVGLALAAVSLGILVTLLAWGALADRIGERPVLAAGLAGTAVALTAGALAPGFAGVLAALVAAGMLGASATGASGRAVMGWFGRRERGFALGVRQTAVPLGGGVAALTLPLLAAAGGLRAALLALAGGCLAAAAVAGLWMREPPPAPAGRPRVTAPTPVRDARIWRLGAGSALLVCAQSGLLGFVVLFLHDERGWAAASAALVLAAIHAGGAVARVTAGRWSDRLELRVEPLRRLGSAGAALLALAALAATGAPGPLLVPLLIAAGALASSWNGLSFTAAAEMSGRERAGTAMGLQNTLLTAAGVATPLAFAALVTATSWPAAFALLTLCPLAGLAVLAPLRDEERERRAARGRRLSVPATVSVNPS
jgi:sugar phosphate permease